MSYSTVIVGSDGSDSSYLAVRRAAEVAAGSGATLVVICAYRRPSKQETDEIADRLGDEAYKVMGASPAESVLGEAADRARAAGANAVQTESVEGEPVDALVDAAVRRNAELIVVGNRGLNSLAGRLLGSVPSQVSHRAHCDVLIVRTTGR